MIQVDRQTGRECLPCYGSGAGFTYGGAMSKGAEGRASPPMHVNLSTTLSTGLTSYPQGQSGQTIGAELYKANGKVKG